MIKVLLSLDLSTSATGWAKFDLLTKELLTFGVILPKSKKAGTYPKHQTEKLRTLAGQVLELVDESVQEIVIEEINRGKNRLGQKTLDGFHYILLEKMSPETINKVSFRDSDGNSGWRSEIGLNLKLSEFDKATNKERGKLNKKLPKKEQLPLITKKTLACRFVNKQFGLALDADKRETDGDQADAIGLGWFYLNSEYP